MDMAFDTHDPEISKRRRIVYTGLLPYLEGDELFKAMWIWENQFAQAPAIQYRHFIEAITTDNESPVKSKQLYLSLVSASLAKDSKKLKADPYNEMIAYKSLLGHEGKGVLTISGGQL